MAKAIGPKEAQRKMLRENQHQKRSERPAPPVPKPVRLDKAKKAIEDVANSPSPKNVANVDMANKSTYKYRDPEARKAYQRDLMRKRREKT